MDTELHKADYNLLPSRLLTSWASHQIIPRSLWTSPDSIPACVGGPGWPIGVSSGPLCAARTRCHCGAHGAFYVALLTHG